MKVALFLVILAPSKISTDFHLLVHEQNYIKKNQKILKGKITMKYTICNITCSPKRLKKKRGMKNGEPAGRYSYYM